FLWAAATASALAQTGAAVPPVGSSEHRGGGAPILPEIELAPPALPAPVPSAPLPPAATAKPELRRSRQFVLRGVHFTGNTVLDEASLQSIVAPYIGKSVTLDDLEEIRQRLTRLYIERGYVNSGAVIPDQDVANGVVDFRFVEGRITDIDVSGTR